MTLTLDLLLRNADNIGFKLIPHVEEAALKYALGNYVMGSRMLAMSDMQGWNARKISSYLPTRRAKELAEDTAIPSTKALRARKATIEPKEIGDRYRITERRSSTDLESVIADTVSFLGEAIGSKIESDAFATALSTFRGGTLGSGASDYSLNLMLQAATLFRARRKRGQLFHVIHPYQALPVMESLIDYAGAQVNPTYRDAAANRLANTDITEFDLPTFGNVNLAVGERLPRRVIFKLAVLGDGGTFRLQVGDDGVIGENITAAITVSTTAATMVTNVQTALNALDMSGYYSGAGTWTVSGTDIANLTITPPTDMHLEDAIQLRVAVKQDEDATLDGGFIEANLQKSAYDLVTNPDGSITDQDGNSIGVALYERSATAKSLLFQRESMIFDIRRSVTSHFELVYQGRTAEYAASMVYGLGGWSPELGMFIETKANSPLAVGA